MWTKTDAVNTIIENFQHIKNYFEADKTTAGVEQIERHKAIIEGKSGNLPDIFSTESNCIVNFENFENFTTEYKKAQDTLEKSFEDGSLLKKLYENLNLFVNFETVHTIQDGINDSHPSKLDEKYSNFETQQNTFEKNLKKIIDALECLNDFVLIDIRKKAEAKRIADEQKAAEEKAAAEKKAEEEAAAAAMKRAEEEAAAMKRAEEEAAAKKKAEEEAAAAMKKAEEDAAAAKKKAEEEAAAMKKAEEDAAAKKKAEEEAAAKKKAEEEAAAKKKAEEEAAAAAKKKAEEDAAAAEAENCQSDYYTSLASDKSNLIILKNELGVSDVTGMDVDKYPGLSTTASEEFTTFQYSWNKLKQYERKVRENFGKKEFDYIFLVYLVGYVNIFICNINNILSQMRLAIEDNTALVEHVTQLKTEIVRLKTRMIEYAFGETPLGKSYKAKIEAEKNEGAPNFTSAIAERKAYTDAKREEKGIYFSKYYAIAFVAFFGNSGIFIKDFFRLLQPIVEVVSNQNNGLFTSLVDKTNINISDITSIIDTRIIDTSNSKTEKQSGTTEMHENVYLLIIKITTIFAVLFNKSTKNVGQDIILIEGLQQIEDLKQIKDSRQLRTKLDNFKSKLDNFENIRKIIEENIGPYKTNIEKIISGNMTNMSVLSGLQSTKKGGKKMTRKKKGKKPQKRTRHHKKNVTRPLRKNKTKPTKKK